MRQAGRYMAEYRAIRAEVDFWTLCKTPDLCCEVTLQPIDAFNLDAAIIFSDLLVSLPPIGYNVQFLPGRGPVVDEPINTVADLDWRNFDVADELAMWAKCAVTACLPDPAYRVCWCPLYPRELSTGRRVEQAIHEDQGFSPSRAEGGGAPLRGPESSHHRSFEIADG